jgi:hypothetical protein
MVNLAKENVIYKALRKSSGQTLSPLERVEARERKFTAAGDSQIRSRYTNCTCPPDHQLEVARLKENQILTKSHPFVPFVNPSFVIELAAIRMCGITRGRRKGVPVSRCCITS